MTKRSNRIGKYRTTPGNPSRKPPESKKDSDTERTGRERERQAHMKNGKESEATNKATHEARITQQQETKHRKRYRQIQNEEKRETRPLKIETEGTGDGNESEE